MATTKSCCRLVSLSSVSMHGPIHTRFELHCYPKGCAAPGLVPCQCNTQGSPSKLKRAPSQAKINVTSKSPVGDISVVTLIRTDTTLDHSQKAEKVWHGSGDASGAIVRKGRTGESWHDLQRQWHQFCPEVCHHVVGPRPP